MDVLAKYPAQCTQEEKRRVQSFARIFINVDYAQISRYSNRKWPKYRCPDVRPLAYHPGIEEGQAIPATALHPGIRELAELPCPPPPLFDRLGVKPKRTVVTFVQKDSSASAIHLRRLAGQYGQEEGEQSSKVVVVIDRTNRRETESLKNELGLDFVMLADPTGKITIGFASVSGPPPSS